MRAVFVSTIFLLLPACAGAQQNCSSPAATAAERQLHAAQQKALAIKVADVDSGVPTTAVAVLRDLKFALAETADAVVGCEPVSQTAAQIENILKARLRASAPDVAVSKNAPDDAPIAGVFGNKVAASVRLFTGVPRLLAIALDSSVPCGSDSQLLLYGQENGHWVRQLRWSASFDPAKDMSNAWGDTFLFDILRNPAAPEKWHVVVVHGTPWCTSRFSSFGMAVLGPVPHGTGADVLWQSERDYSRGDYATRLRIVAPDTFELRLHTDEMSFNQDDAFERLVVYRYRLHERKVTRLQPIAANARGFVEEWLSMPWSEALEQLDGAATDPLSRVHSQYAESYAENANKFTSWKSGPVRACTGGKRFQATFDSEVNEIVPGKPGGNKHGLQHHYFQLGALESGYLMLGVSSTSDSSCAGPDLMQKRAY